MPNLREIIKSAPRNRHAVEFREWSDAIEGESETVLGDGGGSVVAFLKANPTDRDMLMRFLTFRGRLFAALLIRFSSGEWLREEVAAVQHLLRSESPAEMNESLWRYEVESEATQSWSKRILGIRLSRSRIGKFFRRHQRQA